MKKKNLTGLNFEKKVISNLQIRSIKAGSVNPTFQTGCNSEPCNQNTWQESCLRSDCRCL